MIKISKEIKQFLLTNNLIIIKLGQQTAPEIVMIDTKHKEALRLAERANSRSR